MAAQCLAEYSIEMYRKYTVYIALIESIESKIMHYNGASIRQVLFEQRRVRASRPLWRCGRLLRILVSYSAALLVLAWRTTALLQGL